MLISRRIKLFLLLALLHGQETLAAPDGWELARDSEGVQVYTREVPGSKFRAFRGETVIAAGLNQLMAVLDDTAGMSNWMYKAKNPDLLQKVSLLDRYQYLVNDFPWPANDRELIIRNQIHQDVESRLTTITLEGVTVEQLPEQARLRVPDTNGMVRVSQLQGFFELKPLGDSQTAVVYQLHLDPVGSLPSSMVNALIVDNPFETLKSLSEVAKLPRYQCFNPF